MTTQGAASHPHYLRWLAEMREEINQTGQSHAGVSLILAELGQAEKISTNPQEEKSMFEQETETSPGAAPAPEPATPKPVTGMTDRQGTILNYLKHCEQSPTMREIADHVGISNPSSVSRDLAALEDLGLISRPSGAYQRRRTIALTDEGRAVSVSVSVPVAGAPAGDGDLVALTPEEAAKLWNAVTGGRLFIRAAGEVTVQVSLESFRKGLHPLLERL